MKLMINPCLSEMVSRTICSSFPTVEVVARDASFSAGLRFNLDVLRRRTLAGWLLTLEHRFIGSPRGLGEHPSWLDKSIGSGGFHIQG